MNEAQQNAIKAQAELDATDVEQIQVALDEVNRELQVRERCFPRWIAEARISKSDAKDRLERQKYAAKLLQMLLDSRGVPATA